jgi:hypothetical protein
MAQGLNSTKSADRPSHEAIESNAPATELNKSERERIDDAAMQSAKRATNRIRSNEDSTPGNSIFTK